MSSERILSIDYGSKRVGLAATDALGLTLQPWTALQNRSRPDLLKNLLALIQEKEIKKVIIGLPRSLDGNLGPQAIVCMKFAEDLSKATEITIEMQDESFTSREADEILIRDLDLSREKRKKVKDSMAALLILKSYLQVP